MNKFFTLSIFFFLFLLVNNALGQTSTVSGKIIEMSTKEPMEFVTVGMYHAKDSSLVTGINTNKNGVYTFPKVAEGNYFLQVTFVGFETVNTPVFSASANTPVIELPATAITLSSKLLNAVEVIEEKALYESSIDRKVYNVDKDLMSKSGSASEILSNVPSISVDAEGAVSLRGSGNVTILINGKPSPMMKVNSAAALQAIPANTIERIEVITNPSAKYRPDGAAGIINIVLKKDTKQGFNGLITANASDQSRYNSTLTMNYKPGKLNLYGTYGFRKDNRPRKMTDLRTIYDSVPTTYRQIRTSEARPTSHNVTGGADYSINDKNVIGVSGTYFYMDFLRQENTAIILHDEENKVTSDYNRDRIDKEYEYEKEISASYEHLFKKEDHAIQFEFNFADHFEQEDNHYTETYRTPYKPQTYDNTLIKQFEKQTECLVEYVYPINEDSELEAGYNWVALKQNFDFYGEYFDTLQNSFIKDFEKSNRFNFTQNVHALYATYSQSIEDFSFLLGLRAEQAYITSNLVTMDSIIQNNYFKIYPTIHLSYELDDNKELQLSYSKRVNRPEGDELNPFPEYRDPRNINAGNPNLKPEQIHSVELGYQYKNRKFSIFPSIFYRYMYDGFAEISKYINDSTLLTTSTNLATDQSVGLELVLTTQVKKILSLNLSGNAFYNQIDASNLGYSAKKSAFSYTAKLGANINLTTSTVMQINTNYSSSRLTPQGKYLPIFTLNAGVRQDILKKKASILLTMSDVFNTLRWRSEIDTPVLSQKITSKRTSQIIYLGFTYRFGRINKTPEELKFDDKM